MLLLVRAEARSKHVSFFNEKQGDSKACSENSLNRKINKSRISL